MPAVIPAAATALPDHRYDQATITDAFADVVLGRDADRRVLERLHEATGVRSRHLALPIERYRALSGFGEANDEFIRVGLDLGERAVSQALAMAGLTPRDVDVLMVTSVTGMAAPSLDARLIPRLGLREDLRRLPVFGLGCVAGAAGLARLAELVAGDPQAVAVLLSVELCSLTVQRDDASMANLVASGLFGDGAAAVVLAGADRATRAAPRVVASRSRLYPGTERVMGWDIDGSGLRIVLDPGVAELVRSHVGADVEAFLADHDLKVADIATWLAHPGGPKVLRALASSVGLPDEAFARTWRSLAEVGNLSSASVLHVLADALQDDAPPPGSPGLLMAMGPGFCSELVLLRW